MIMVLKYHLLFKNGLKNIIFFKKANHTTNPIGYITITTIKNERQEYQSKSLHYHTKSEHTLNGIQYDAELHMVFERVDPKALEDNYCVLGFMFNIDDSKAKKHGRDLINTFKPAQPDVCILYKKK